jgi:ferric enterobactin receptor
MTGQFLAFLCAAAVAGATAESDPPAAEPPPANPADPQPAPPEDKPLSDVVVVAERPAVVNQIDRQVYDVRKDPEAQTASVMDILGKIPSVTTTPAGGVLLLGQTGVRVLIDGKPGSSRGLRGADIERIEVMTNPSAQYAPQGSAGIINIITRKDRRQGLTGTVTAGGDSHGGYRISAGPNFVKGRWTLSGSLGGGSQNSETSSEVRRREDDGFGGDVQIREANRYVFRTDDVSGGLKAAFRRSDSQRYYLNLQGYRSSGRSEDRMRSVSDDASVPSYTERSDGPIRFSSLSIDGGFDWTSPTEGETLALSFSANPYDNLSRSVTEDDFDDPALPALRYRQVSRSDNFDLEIKADYKRPFSGSRILTLGSGWTREDQTDAQLFETLSGPDPVRNLDQSIHGVRDVWSSYATWQFPLWTWAFMPGLRVEAERFDVASGGAIGSSRDVFWYPSLHITRDFGDTIKLNVSYSRRIDRPSLSQLDPAVHYSSATLASSGNPELEAVSVDAYEARLDYSKGSFGAGLTLYSRESSGTWSSFTTLTPAGVRLSTTVNAGESANRGAEVALRGKVAGNWQYAVTTNLFWREQQVLDVTGPRADNQFSYSGNSQLTWKSAPAKPDSGDQVQLGLRYLGPTRWYQGDSDGFLRADLTWRRPFTPRLTGVLTLSDILDSSERHSRLKTTYFDQDATYRGAGPEARFSLTYRLGGQ